MRKDWPGTAGCLDGLAVAAKLKNDLKNRISRLSEMGVKPGLGTILVGDDPASRTYVNGKHRDCLEVGIESLRCELPADISQTELLAEIAKFNHDPRCTAYIVQLPLPKQIDTSAVLEAIDPNKDADGLHPTNLGKLLLRVKEAIDSPLPCTPQACLTLLNHYGIALAGKFVCVIGRGTTVGRSLPALLTRKAINATVVCCHTGTTDLDKYVKLADVVISGAGVAGIVKPEMLKPGVVLLDVGISRGQVNQETGKAVLLGDIADGCDTVAKWISPNPGGIGPLTRVCLLLNVVEIAERKAGIRK